MDSNVFNGLSSMFIRKVPNFSIPVNMSKRQNLGLIAKMLDLRWLINTGPGIQKNPGACPNDADMSRFAYFLNIFALHSMNI